MCIINENFLIKALILSSYRELCMDLKNSPSLLNTDELELLSELMSQDDAADSKKLEYNLSSSAKGESLLIELGRARELKLSAKYGNHLIVFPVQITADDFASLQMILKAPKIFEAGNELRSWRFITRNKNIYLANEDEDALHFQINDLSASGISLLIGDRAQAEFPAVLNHAFLCLPNGERLAIPGLQLSRIDEKTVAYSLAETTDEAVLASLCEYLFECHAQQYPEVHTY